MEQKRFDKKNLIVLAAVMVLIAVVAVVAATQKRVINPTLGPLEPDPTATPAVQETAASEENQPEETQLPDATELPEASGEAPRQPAEAYLVVTVAGAMYEPIPLNEECRYTITRGDLVNTIQVTPDSIAMYESSCDNQDCVEQGVVSLENRSKRVLQNLIICMPNEVVLELYTAEELAALLLELAEYTEEAANE